MAEILRDPGSPPAQPAAMDLSTLQTKIQEAFRAGNLTEVSRLNALARIIQQRLDQDSRSDSRFRRYQMNPEAASSEDREYAERLIRNLGAARQMVEITNQASEVSEVDSPGPSVGEEVAGVAAAGAAGEGASRAATSRLAKPLADATKTAAFDLRQGASIAEATGKKARKASGKAGGAVGRAKQAVTRAERAAAAPKPGTKGATTKALKGAQRALAAEQAAAGAAKREAGRLTGEAATKRAAAKGFVSTAARAAPRIFGAMPMGLAEVAIGPILAFYKTTQQAESFLGQIESLSNAKGAPLSVEDLNTDALDALSTSPVLLDSMLKSGIIDNSTYAFANPEGAAEMGLQVGGGGIQRGGDVFTVGDVEGARMADPGEDFGYDPMAAQRAASIEQIQREFGAKTSNIPRIGSDLPDIEPNDSTPVARQKAVAKAMGKRASGKAAPKKPAPPKSKAPQPKAASDAGDAPVYSSDGLFPEAGQRDPSFEMPTTAPVPTPGLASAKAKTKSKKLGKGLEKLLEAFATMDIKVDSDSI